MATRQTTKKSRREPKAEILKFTRPDEASYDGKAVVRLAQSDILFSAIQIIKAGGDNNLHSHAGMDGLWFVLSGRARFYGTEEDVVIAELDTHQGIFIPRNFPYWFEQIGADTLELLQVEAIDRSVKNTRKDYKNQKSSATDVQMFRMDGSLLTAGIINPGLDDDDIRE